MANAELIDEETVQLTVSMEQASLLKMVLGRFNPQASNLLKEVYEELDDLGVDSYSNVTILTQGEPTLFIVIQDTEDDDEVV